MVKLKTAQIPENIKFLLVDDHEQILEVLKMNLESFGFTGPFYTASSTEEAISFLEKNPVDYILSDWNMAGESGFDFLKLVRNTKGHENVPFVMVTGNDNVSGVLLAIKNGASEYIIKPWTEEELSEKIEYAWSKHIHT